MNRNFFTQDEADSYAHYILQLLEENTDKICWSINSVKAEHLDIYLSFRATIFISGYDRSVVRGVYIDTTKLSAATLERKMKDIAIQIIDAVSRWVYDLFFGKKIYLFAGVTEECAFQP